ncbi:MAG TPA: cytochrome c peroxidase [Chitinophagaceae bacterium]|nr:cytochrome c peroxidase [Chitinophagaceae bacterium]
MRKWCIVLPAVLLVFIQASLTGNAPKDKVALGRHLFFDPILSRDKTISCGSCHQPAYAFADTLAVSRGVKKRKGKRNTPSVMNITGLPYFFWDGRSASLEEQALAPIANPDEMDLPVHLAVQRLNANKNYKAWFRDIFHSEATANNLAQAIAAFERTLETSNSAFDDWKMNNNNNAVSEAAKRGFVLFGKKGKCTQCHFGADFTQHQFKNIGLFNGKDLNDSGRMAISGNAADIGKFKTPGLRNIAVTAPYMHNGMFNTLAEVIEFYNDPEKRIPHSINRDTVLLKPLGLTNDEKKDLEAFLLSLTDQQFLQKK